MNATVRILLSAAVNGALAALIAKQGGASWQACSLAGCVVLLTDLKSKFTPAPPMAPNTLP